MMLGSKQAHPTIGTGRVCCKCRGNRQRNPQCCTAHLGHNVAHSLHPSNAPLIVQPPQLSRSTPGTQRLASPTAIHCSLDHPVRTTPGSCHPAHLEHNVEHLCERRLGCSLVDVGAAHEVDVVAGAHHQQQGLRAGPHRVDVADRNNSSLCCAATVAGGPEAAIG